jgi:hypothetical protein
LSVPSRSTPYLKLRLVTALGLESCLAITRLRRETARPEAAGPLTCHTDLTYVYFSDTPDSYGNLCADTRHIESFGEGAQQASASIFRVAGGWGNAKYVYLHGFHLILEALRDRCRGPSHPAYCTHRYGSGCQGKRVHCLGCNPAIVGAEEVYFIS